jgi:hypothetical protein
MKLVPDTIKKQLLANPIASFEDRMDFVRMIAKEEMGARELFRLSAGTGNHGKNPNAMDVCGLGQQGCGSNHQNDTNGGQIANVEFPEEFSLQSDAEKTAFQLGVNAVYGKQYNGNKGGGKGNGQQSWNQQPRNHGGWNNGGGNNGGGKSTRIQGNCYTCTKQGHKAIHCKGGGKGGKGNGINSVENKNQEQANSDDAEWTIGALVNEKDFIAKNSMKIMAPPGLSNNKYELLKTLENEDPVEKDEGLPIMLKKLASQREMKKQRAATYAQTIKKSNNEFNFLGPLTVEGGVISPVQHEKSKDWNGMRFTEVMVDSGASEHVASPTSFPEVEMKESEGSRSGLNYVAANGHKIPNIGQQDIKLMTAEGHNCTMKFQSANVTRPILSVPKLTASGHSCVFKKDGGTITNIRTGQTTQFHRKEGVYLLGIWLKSPDAGKPEQGFRRQGLKR